MWRCMGRSSGTSIISFVRFVILRRALIIHFFVQPRPHEAGGKYGQGVIVRKYKTGSVFTIRVELTANHKGFFEFRLCPNNAPKKVASQQCLDKYLLKRSKMLMKDEENFHETR